MPHLRKYIKDTSIWIKGPLNEISLFDHRNGIFKNVFFF